MQVLLRSIVLLLLPFAGMAQKTVAPGSPDINTDRLKAGKSLYTIYYVKDNNWTKKGSFTNEIIFSGNDLKFIADYKDDKDKWYKKRTSVTDAKTLSSRSYKSEGLKNTMELNFGTTVTGKMHFLTGEKDKQITITPTGKFVDWNVSEILFTTLPLSTGYKAVIPEFYYATGVSPDSVLSNYIIKDVKSYVYRSPKTGEHETWLVKVLEESSGAYYTYVIDKKDYRIWQREMPEKGGVLEVCVNEELDYQPIQNRFNKELSLQMVEKGNSVITGTAFARDHGNSKIAVVNINKAQFAPRGTVVSILANSAYIEEWKEVNKKIRKRNKIPEVPIDPNVSACIKKTTVYDDKGHFEFTNLMPGEYILITSFGYTHQYSYSYYAGTSSLVHPSGAVLSSSPIYKSANAATGATAEIELKVTIKTDGEKVDVKLKDVR